MLDFGDYFLGHCVEHRNESSKIMNADVFFTMGSTHKICQDYAVSHSDEKFPFAILSDGCSSAIDTDFGSRLLVKATQPDIYQYNWDYDLLLYNAIKNAHTFCRTLSLADESLCATLMIAKLEDNFFRILCAGDGYIAAKRPNGTIDVYEFAFEQGAPYYLRYELNPEIKNGYFEKFGDKTEVLCNQTSYTINANGVISAKKITACNVTKSNIHFEVAFPIAEFEAVAIMSDGVGSFVKQTNTLTTKNNALVPAEEIIKELMAFKSYAGGFVQRRCQKAFKKFKDQGMQNCDDVSIAVISNAE